MSHFLPFPLLLHAFTHLKEKYEDFRIHTIKVTPAPYCLLPKLTSGCSEVACHLTTNSS